MGLFGRREEGRVGCVKGAVLASEEGWVDVGHCLGVFCVGFDHFDVLNGDSFVAKVLVDRLGDAITFHGDDSL